MSRIASSTRRVWKSAQLYIGFHRDPEGRRRREPHVWPPKNGNATIHRDPAEQEAFVVVKSAEGDTDQDIQIKLRPDMIVLRRDDRTAWEGVKIDRFTVSVKVGDVSIRINPDGSVTREDSDSTTWIEADGGVLKKTEFVEAVMSGDGTELKRRTPSNVAAITQDGVLSKDR
ncbi:hypothetical protein [uncultured Roseovarius sp.]|uniref:hypothetical protein n=1 Tax=uncultured Roseovarius sp. TaxID=293344 RepID=UPI002616F6C2|nr:hypothetical protein [uncultured Roseovarius sp.]